MRSGGEQRRRDHRGLAGQRLLTAWARIATIERGPNDVARYCAAWTDHVGHTVRARPRRSPHFEPVDDGAQRPPAECP